MKPEIRVRKGAIILLLVLFASEVMMPVVLAASFSFLPNIDSTVFNLSEDTRFFYDLNVTVTESLVYYSSNAPALGFTSFAMNNVTGIINFTPPNEDVNYYAVTLIAENRSNAFDKVTITVGFNVSNTNDAPNITGYSPSGLNFSVRENSTTEFTFNATDSDSIFGDTLNTTWYLDHIAVSRNSIYNFTPSFCDADLHNLTLKVNDTSNANATVSWNITVNNTNRPPLLNQSLLNVTWAEDTNRVNNVTLGLFLSDRDFLECSNDDQDAIAYTATGNASINITINQTSTNASYYVRANYFGVETVRFVISDGINTTYSNYVVLNVTNVNDAPQLNYSNRTAFQNVLFLYDLNATDPDNEIQSGINTLTYYDNISFFNISPTTGLINFTADVSMLGVHPANISVDDGFVNTSVLIYLNISSNAIPSIYNISNRNATEGTFFFMNITASDADNDNITFAANFSSLIVTKINLSAANLSFTPSSSDVGNRTILVTATDPYGASSSTIFNLTVFNVNNAPNLTFIPNQTLRTDKVFGLTVSATDLDSDNLTLSDNTSLFSISYVSANSGSISFTPTGANAGNHTVNISVSDGELTAYQIVHFVIRNNSNPILSGLRNQTFPEDSLFTFQTNASDPDNDTLAFYSNLSFLSISAVNATSALINFTPNQSNTGLHWVNITVNDTPLMASVLIFFNITVVNDTPYFNPPIPDLNASMSMLFVYDVNATDDENDTLIYYSNATIFNISNSTGIINFTPTLAQVGSYSIKINATDGNSTNQTIITFRVLEQNVAPNITGFYPNQTNISLAEGYTQIFNVTVSDANGNSLFYNWSLNGTIVSNLSDYLYVTNYSSQGFYNLTALVSDALLSDKLAWNITVNNTNRLPVYGIVNFSSESDFAGGNKGNVNITAQSGNITLAKSNGVIYVPQGNFTAAVIDLIAGSNLTLLNISWREVRPENTTILFQLRTSRDNSTFSEFEGNSSMNYTAPNGTTINASSNRYIQYKAILTTNNTNATPVIPDIMITFKISDFAGREDTVYLNYLDLDNFFSDPDGDSLTYNASAVANIEFDIDSSGRVSLTPDANFAGTRYVVFTATDGFGNRTSNNITITLADVSEPGDSTTTTTTSSGGGGGGGRRTVYVNKTIIVNQSRSIEIITPQQVEKGLNEEIIVPIVVQNNENYAMTGITLSASTNISDIDMYFSDDSINRLEPGEKTSVDLVIERFNVSMSFDVKIAAVVLDPGINDSALISIRINDNVTKQISFVRDFIQLNPECLELSEVIDRAAVEIGRANYVSAKVLLDKAIEQCKYILTTKRANVEQPTAFFALDRMIRNKYFIYSAVMVLLGLFATISYVVYNRIKWY